MPLPFTINSLSISLIGNVDYSGFTDDLVLPAGSTSFSYNITILSDDSVEQPEVFNVDVSYVSGSSLTVTGSDATVTITDPSSETLCNYV